MRNQKTKNQTNVALKFGALLAAIVLFFFLVSPLVKATAPSLVSSSSLAQFSIIGGNIGSVVLNKPAGLQNGDMVVVYIKTFVYGVSGSLETTTSTPVGWTKLTTFHENWGAGDLNSADVAYKYITNASSETATYSFDIFNDSTDTIGVVAGLVQVRGTGSTVPAGAFGKSILYAPDELILPSVVSQGDSLWLISGLGNGLGGTPYPDGTPPVGFTNLESRINNSTSPYLAFSIDYKSVPIGATGTATYPNYANSGFNYTSLLLCGGSSIEDVSYYPDNTVYIPRVTTLRLTLNQNVQKGSGNIYIKRYSDDTTLLTIPVSDSKVTIENDVVKIRVASCFAAGEQVYVEIDAGAFTAGCNYSYPGLNDKNLWKFVMVRTCNELYSEL